MTSKRGKGGGNDQNKNVIRRWRWNVKICFRVNWLEESCRLFFLYIIFFFLSCLLLLYLACTLPVLQVYRAQRLRTPGRCENGRASVETAVTWSESSEPPAREKDKREYCGEKNLIKNWREKNRFEKSIGKWNCQSRGFVKTLLRPYGEDWGFFVLAATRALGMRRERIYRLQQWARWGTRQLRASTDSRMFDGTFQYHFLCSWFFFFLNFFCSVFCSQDLWPVVNTLLRRACTSTLKILLYCCLKATVAAAGCKFIDFLDRAFLSFAPLSKHHCLKSSTNNSRKDVYSLFDSFGNLHFTSSI